MRGKNQEVLGEVKYTMRSVVHVKFAAQQHLLLTYVHYYMNERLGGAGGIWAPLAIFCEFRVDNLNECDFYLVRYSTNSFYIEMGERVGQNTLPGMKTHPHYPIVLFC